MGHERLSSRARSHAPVERLAGGAHRSEIALSLVLLRLHALLGARGLAWSANSLIAFRVLQGMSGGLMAPLAAKMTARADGRIWRAS